MAAAARAPALAAGRAKPTASMLPRPLRWAPGAPARLAAWAYRSADRRDLRIDALRGFAAFAMVVDHYGGASFLYFLTGGNRFFVSGAELFIFISGLLVGLVYATRVARDGLAAVQMRLLRRALTLYLVTIGLTYTFIGLSRLAEMPWLPQAEPLTPELVVSILTLHRTYYLVDVMLFYTIALALAPLAVVLLVQGSTWVLLGLSAGLWALFQLFPQQAEVPWPIANNEVFRFGAWQVWFYGGMVIGYHKDRLWQLLGRLPRRPTVLALVGAAVFLVWLRLADPVHLNALAPGGNGQALLDLLFDKHFARPGRLVAFAVFFSLFPLGLTSLWRPIAQAAVWLLLPFGQNALYVYAMHLFVVYLSALVLPYVALYDRFNPWSNTAMQLLAVGVLWLLVRRRVLFDLIPR